MEIKLTEEQAQEITSKEIWRDVVGFTDYEVSNQGRVRSKQRTIERTDGKLVTYKSRMREPVYQGERFPNILLRKDKKSYTKSVARMVIEAFYGIPDDGAVVMTVNGNREDARLTNLRWTTLNEVHKDVYTKGRKGVRGSGNYFAKLNEGIVISIRKEHADGVRMTDLSKKYEVAYSTIHHIVNRVTWKHLGE